MILYCMGTSCQLGAASGMLSLHAGYWEGGFLSSGLLSFPWASIIPPRAFLSNARGAFGEGGNPSLDLSFPHPVSFPPSPFVQGEGCFGRRRESTSPSLAVMYHAGWNYQLTPYQRPRRRAWFDSAYGAFVSYMVSHSCGTGMQAVLMQFPKS